MRWNAPGSPWRPGANAADLAARRERQIDRRLREQAVTGNVSRVGDTYRITQRGRLVVAVAQWVAWLFDSHAGLAAPRADGPHDALATRR